MSFLRKQESIQRTGFRIPRFHEDWHVRNDKNDKFILLEGLLSNTYYVYILASKKNGTLYTGVTNNLIKRVHEHKNDFMDGFTKKYQVHCLAYYETFNDIEEAITREKRIKKWKRQWKIELIESMNPDWRDLYDELL